jgi:hypothetical protein
MLSLFVGFALAGCLSREAMQELQAKQKARIEAARIPEVQLSQAQIAKLQEVTPRGQITWLRAGRQSDGRIFVCHVASGKPPFGGSAGLITGFFEPDGSYQRSPAHFMSLQAVLEDCHERGFEPPIAIVRR